MVDRAPTKQIELQRYLGPQLIDAGLLTQDQVQVIYIDQDLSGLPFSEIVVSRGWVKEQTVDYIMRRVILTNHLMATIKDLRSARDVLVRELDAYRKKPQAFSQKSPVQKNFAQPNSLPFRKPTHEEKDDDGIDWIG